VHEAAAGPPQGMVPYRSVDPGSLGTGTNDAVDRRIPVFEKSFARQLDQEVFCLHLIQLVLQGTCEGLGTGQIVIWILAALERSGDLLLLWENARLRRGALGGQ